MEYTLHSLDRRDNGGNYTCGECEDCMVNNYPLNIRWATAKEQSQNVSTNIVVEYNGEKMCLVEAARRAGLPYKTVFSRIKICKWSVFKSLNTPLLKRKYIYNGKPLDEIAIENRISKRNLYERVVNQGLSVEEALSKPLLKRNRIK